MEQPPRAPVAIVAGLSRIDRGIGFQNTLLWHVPEDLRRFKTLTLGKPVIMGRKTFESIVAILGKPLPHRTNIVITRNPDYTFSGVAVVHSLHDAFAAADAHSPDEIHIGGGAELYAAALPYVDRLYLTWFDEQKPADTFFPEFENEFSVITTHEPKTAAGVTFTWVDYVRNNH